MNDFKIPDYFEPVVGWRAWHLSLVNHDLLSLNKPTIWPERKALNAMCYAVKQYGLPVRLAEPIHPLVPAPVEKCGCGIWAMKTKNLLTRYLSSWYDGNQIFVIGEVKLWGDIIQGEKGWRAQKAYPVSFEPHQGVSKKDIEELKYRFL